MQVDKLDNLKTASYFSKNTLQQVVRVNDNAIYANIKRWLQQGRLLQLKRGLYVTKDYYLQLNNKQAYAEFIANQLKTPSYLSLEYVLQQYSILSESVYALTSVTLKRANKYKNQLGLFTYSQIAAGLFMGYKLINVDGFTIKKATKAKALFDFLYLRLIKAKEASQSLIDSYRLNLEEFSKQDKAEFKQYVALSENKKLREASVWLKI
jgi:predicted transcriptional regulator of viral defense system